MSRFATGDRAVGVFWDFQSCPPPTTVTAYDAVQRLRTLALSFGDSIAAFRVYTSLPRGHKSEGEPTLRTEMQQRDASIINCPPLGAKNILDRVLLVDILAFARTQPDPAVIFVISSTQGYESAFSLLRGQQHLIVLLPPSLAFNPALRAQTDFLLSWEDVFGQSTPRESASAKASQRQSRWLRQTRETSTGGEGVGGPNIADGTATVFGQSEHNGLWGRVAKYTNNPPTQASSTSRCSPSTPSISASPTSTRHGDASPPPIPLGERWAPDLSRALRLSDIPAYFHDLIHIVHGCRGVPASKVSERLLERNPRLYEQAGFGDFQNYIDAAVQVGVVSRRTGIKKGKPRQYIDTRKGYIKEWMEKSRFVAQDGS